MWARSKWTKCLLTICMSSLYQILWWSLQWRRNEHDGVSNLQPPNCLLKRLFRHRSKKTSKIRVTGLCVRVIHRWPVNCPHRWPVTRRMFPFDDVIMGYSCVSGFGTSIMCLAPTSVCAQNFSGRVRGVIIGLTQSCHMLGPALFGQIYASWFAEGPIGNYFLFVAITCVAMNLFSIWILRPIPAYSGNDGEQVRLLESHTVSFIDDNDSPSSGWMECVGLDLMKIPAFHLISWCFLLPVSLQLVVFTNITTMAASLGFDKLGIMLPIWGPVAAFIIGLTSGFISDLTVKHMSRVFYATVGNSLQTLFFILSIFWGDTPSIFTGLVIVSYINNGFLFATIPTLSSEYFGTHHFMRNWGAETFTSAVLSFILGLVLGGFYQNAITNGGTECYGLICFETMFIIGSVLSAFSVLLCGMMWHVEHIKARQRGYERTNWMIISKHSHIKVCLKPLHYTLIWSFTNTEWL